MEKHAIIAVSGKSGCGNTTVSRIIAEKLGFNLINYTLRNLAADLGISLDKLLSKAQTDSSYDFMLDKRQKEMALQGNSVVGSRLAIWLLPEATIRVYLYADINVRAGRIHKRESNESFDQILKATQARDFSDHERFNRLYSIDNSNYEFADIIINTELYTPQQIADIIISTFQIRDK